jgi:hypothetical protein
MSVLKSSLNVDADTTSGWGDTGRPNAEDSPTGDRSRRHARVANSQRSRACAVDIVIASFSTCLVWRPEAERLFVVRGGCGAFRDDFSRQSVPLAQDFVL